VPALPGNNGTKEDGGEEQEGGEAGEGEAGEGHGSSCGWAKGLLGLSLAQIV
jgi:hypothetical protein